MKKVLIIILTLAISVIAQHTSSNLYGFSGKIPKSGDLSTNQNKPTVTKLNDAIIPNNFLLEQNYPNPFNPITKIQFKLPKESYINLSVFNMLGQLVTTIYSGKLDAGTHFVEFDGSELPSGIYFYRLESDNFVQTKKMTLMK